MFKSVSHFAVVRFLIPISFDDKFEIYQRSKDGTSNGRGFASFHFLSNREMLDAIIYFNFAQKLRG